MTAAVFAFENKVVGTSEDNEVEKRPAAAAEPLLAEINNWAAT